MVLLVTTINDYYSIGVVRLSWQQNITKEEILRRTGLNTKYTTLSQRWLGHFLQTDLIGRAVH